MAPQNHRFFDAISGPVKDTPGEHFGEDFGGLDTIFCDFGGTLGDPILTLFQQKWGSGNKPKKAGFW